MEGVGICGGRMGKYVGVWERRGVGDFGEAYGGGIEECVG